MAGFSIGPPRQDWPLPPTTPFSPTGQTYQQPYSTGNLAGGGGGYGGVAAPGAAQDAYNKEMARQKAEKEQAERVRLGEEQRKAQATANAATYAKNTTQAAANAGQLVPGYEVAPGGETGWFSGAGATAGGTAARSAARGGGADGGGTTPEDNAEWERRLRLQAQLQADAERRRLEMYGQYLQPGPQVQGGMGAGESAARDAAYARQKDMVGNQSRSALNALQDLMASRGISGSGIEALMSGNILEGGLNNLGEFNRNQLIQDFSRSGELADRDYAGAIQQRGQDMSRLPSILGLMSARY